MEKERAKDSRFAVLIDADNISERYVKAIFDEISNFGMATYKRIYGDWTRPNLGSWKGALLNNSLTPVQQFGYTIGKNATDSAMIIDAMDIYYTGNVDGFYIVSSDSDFTRLAIRLREGGMIVIGMGEKKTPQPFIAACNQFKFLEVLLQSMQPPVPVKAAAPPAIAPSKPAARPAASAPAEPRPAAPVVPVDSDIPVMTSRSDVKKAILAIIDEISDDDGWAYAGTLGNILQNRFPDFDVRNYGYKKFTPFLASFGDVEISARASENGNPPRIFAREAAHPDPTKAPPLKRPAPKQQKTKDKSKT